MVTLKKIKSHLFPLPVTLTTCRAKRDDKSTDNIIPLSWVGIVDFKPHLINIVIGTGKYSCRVIEQTGEFGICVATINIIKQVDICGYTHGDKIDKFKLTNLKKTEAIKINVSLVKECPICMECIVEQKVSFKNHKMFISRVLQTHIDDDFIISNGEPNIQKMNILCYANDQYWSLGEQIENLFFSKNN